MKHTKLISLVAACFSLMWLAETARADINQLTESESRSGWQLLFDGKSFDGWRNYKKDAVSDGWKVVDGAMVREGKAAGDIITKDKYKWFELSLEYNISKGGNSGVMFHVTENNERPWHSGPEIQVQDNVDGHDKQKAGWLYQLYKPAIPKWAAVQNVEVDATRPAGQWNQLYVRIAAQGCEVCMNGVRYYTFNLGDKKWNDLVSQSKFAKFEEFGKAGGGHICLQDHGNLVSFRNVKIRTISDSGEVKQPIDDKLAIKGTLAFPNLKWEEWDAVDETGKLRPLRIIEMVPTRDGTNRLLAASQQGGVWIFENDAKVSEAKLFFDRRGKVKDWKSPGANEEGLLGLAVHPKFKENGQVFLYYTHATEPKSIVSRITYSSELGKADPNSEEVIMEIAQPFKNHNGGSIEFGPDGYLYIALGDGGDRNDPKAAGQDLANLLGKVLRIDIDKTSGDRKYAIPSDNPFVKQDGARPEIFAYGFRNPWRIAFDPETGDLWMGDVGQELWEEINLVTKGGNYGWSVREGSHAFGNRSADAPSAPIGPVWEYDHRIGRSITGGRVFRSSRVPALDGKYIYGDYVTGRVWALDYDREAGSVRRNSEIFGENVAVLGFGHDEGGEVYYLTDSARGHCIYRFDPAD